MSHPKVPPRAHASASFAPRKRPVQARAKATVAAILQAGGEILAAKGYDGLTTNAVAHRAGVSVGTLYQYFPNKEAIVVAIAEGYAENVVALLEEHLERARDLPLDEACRRFVRSLLEVHAAYPHLYTVLLAEVPRIAGVDLLTRYHDAIMTRLRDEFARRGREIDVADLDTAVFILVHAVQAATHAAVLHRPHALSDGSLARALDDLVLRFLGAADR